MQGGRSVSAPTGHRRVSPAVRARPWARRMAPAALAVAAAIVPGGIALAAAPGVGAGPTDAACTPLDATVAGPLLPEANLSVAVDCALVRADGTYTGAIATAPAAFPASRPLGDGEIGFTGIVLPDTFETERVHRLVLIDTQDGRELGSTHLYVNAAGEHQFVDPPAPAIEPSGWRQTIKDTGLADGRADALVKGALVAVAAAALLWRRRTASSRPVPSRR